jgi:hypothetical protein
MQTTAVKQIGDLGKTQLEVEWWCLELQFSIGFSKEQIITYQLLGLPSCQQELLQ